MRRFVRGLAGATVAFAVVIALGWLASPWPRVALIRYFYDRGGVATARSLARHVPAGVASIRDVAYRDGDPAARMDVFFPAAIENTVRGLPTIVWVHGGGWVAGHRSDIANYAQILAAQGFTTVALDYALPPQAVYPAAVEEINAALGYLTRNAAQLHVDSSRFVLAGDSAGAQIAAQVANIVTNPDYAQAMAIEPAVHPAQLVATVLACGAYDLARAGASGGLYMRFFGAAFWAYSGRRDFRDDPRFRLMSVALHLTPHFPPTFLTAGNGDPLESQSRGMARRLRALGVPVETLLYSPGHRPRLPHEYQFNLDTPAGREALQRIVGFLHTHTASR
ncbi:MAG TPA: alpha/beta hydrolase [Rhodanobacteraceae bacterium]|nr:alpha/beta hydrolase [Rhodanobacteraceae bacterium]